MLPSVRDREPCCRRKSTSPRQGLFQNILLIYTKQPHIYTRQHTLFPSRKLVCRKYIRITDYLRCIDSHRHQLMDQSSSITESRLPRTCTFTSVRERHVGRHFLPRVLHLYLQRRFQSHHVIHPSHGRRASFREEELCPIPPTSELLRTN